VVPTLVEAVLAFSTCRIVPSPAVHLRFSLPIDREAASKAWWQIARTSVDYGTKYSITYLKLYFTHKFLT
jgi:hypothetical protein